MTSSFGAIILIYSAAFSIIDSMLFLLKPLKQSRNFKKNGTFGPKVGPSLHFTAADKISSRM